MNLAGKTALITGAGRGIGKGCALELARAGANVVINDRVGSSDIRAAAEEIRALGRDCETIEADVFSRTGCESLVAEALRAVERIDILISNPAFGVRCDFLDYDPDDFEKVIAATLTGGFHVGQLVARHFVKRGGGGKIVFISSVVAEMPLARSVAYAAAKAGYDAVEPWVRDIDKCVASGGSLEDLRKRIADAGLVVPSAVSFFRWLFSTGEEWTQALEQAKHAMARVRAIGGTGIVAPPAGPDQPLDIPDAGRRYRELIRIGEPFGIMPYVELWGFRKTVNRLGQCAGIAIEAHHRQAGIVPDVYHLYKGGSGFDTIRHLSGRFIHIFHFNDVPAGLSRETIRDQDRVWPGDGIVPLTQILEDLRTIGYNGMLSLELFNRDYWKLDPVEAAKTGIEKMRAVIAESGT